jgi:hypothetical protein
MNISRQQGRRRNKGKAKNCCKESAVSRHIHFTLLSVARSNGFGLYRQELGEAAQPLEVKKFAWHGSQAFYLLRAWGWSRALECKG